MSEDALRKMGAQMEILGSIFAAIHGGESARFAHVMEGYRRQWIDASTEQFAKELKEVDYEDLWRELKGDA